MMILRETFKVRTRELDRDGRLKLSAVADYLQEAAARHTNSRGIGMFQLRSRNRFWVLSRLRIDLTDYPVWNESVTVETWPKGSRLVVAARDFRLTGADGRPLGVATSQWLLLNAATRKPGSLEIVTTAFPQLPEVPPAIDAPPPKVPRLPRYDHQIIRKPGFSDIDLNGHLNNARYFDWVVDALPPECHARRIASVAINYLEEIKCGETVTVSAAVIDADTVDVEGTIAPADRAAFRTRILLA
ncbi:MAG: thioesterase [Victivallales bacterium]|nr:thioesterase [Victivallales bacterium]